MAGAVPAVMPFPGESARGEKPLVATAHGSRQDGTLPVPGDASCPGEVGDEVFVQVLEGWGGDGLCSVMGCWVPMALAWRLVGSWNGFSLDASQSQPSLTSSSCSPSVADAVHPPGPWDLRVAWVTALSGDTAATSALQA